MSTTRAVGGCLSLLVESVLLAQLLAGVVMTTYAIYYFCAVIIG